MKAELVPTLQERITQKTKFEDKIGEWREKQVKRADNFMRDQGK